MAKYDDRQCTLCGGECESVVHVLWECPVYHSISLVPWPTTFSVTRRKVTVRVTENGAGLGTRLS